MLKLKTNGLLGKVNIPPNGHPPNEYKWENFDQIIKIFAYCLIYESDKASEFIHLLDQKRFSSDSLALLTEKIVIRMQKECNNPDAFRCMQYFFYPFNAPLPDMAGQRILYTSFIGMVVQYLVTENQFCDYIQYRSVFCQESLIDLNSFDLWERFLKTSDKDMIKNIHFALGEICPAMYKFICENYNIAQQQAQLNYYTLINGKYAFNILLHPTNDPGIALEENNV